MPAVLARSLYGVAALLLVASLIGLRTEALSVARYPVALQDGVPGVVYEPGPQRLGRAPVAQVERLPVIVLAHGFASSRGVMSSLARSFARAGYAVITFDFRGHGGNPQAFLPSLGQVPGGLLDDLDAAVLYARTHPRYDSESLVLMGHSMGAGVAAEYASREPDVAAVVMLSGPDQALGPYTPPNVLLIWGSREPRLVREGARQLGARLAGLERLVLDRTYGDPRRGEAVRLVEVAGLNHWTVLYSAEVARQALAWIHLALQGDVESAPDVAADRRLVWTALGGVAFLVLLSGLASSLAPLIPRQALPAGDAPLQRLGVYALALLAALLLLSASDSFTLTDPARFLPLIGARDLLAFFATSGTLLLVWLARRGELAFAGLLEARTLFASAIVFGFVYLVLGSLALPLADLFLAPHRLGWSALAFLLALPYFTAGEFLLRSQGRSGVWLPIAGRVLTLAALLGGALLGMLSFVVLLATGAFAGLLILFEFLAYRLSRAAPNPWVPSLVQSAWAAWVLAAVFPLLA
jgi:pimeloyl-ACP methyl ester carboxylesterase